MAGHEWEDWFEREEFIGQISDMRVQNLQVEREVVQKRTFTRWMNLHLEKCDPPIEVQDLFRDIQDGHILMALLEELSGCKLLHGFKKSSHRIFRLNNIAKVLSFLEERNVKLVSIDAADVADGNPSIILGLIWNIILFFQIKELTGNIRSQFPSSSSLSSIPTSSDSDTSLCSTPSDERKSASTSMREHSKAIKKLLQWVQKRTRKFGVAVQDFGKSWTSGLAFLAVIKSIDPSLVDMRKALLRTPRENLDDAFRIAHYSLGIPRLLEPEDVTINAPDEQSIMTYVSQFLEHFPEEPEEPCQLIERSVSMCRLNFHDIDSDHIKNGAHRGRVKERSILFQRDCAHPPPKILISSVSEDRSTMSPPFRPTAARSWSSEDFLADSPRMEDISSSVVEEPKEPTNEVLMNSTSDSPQLSYTHSPTGSSVPESVNTDSVIGDSAISSPDSWVESEFGVLPEKFCESRSDSSLCDSGTAWDVYRATPVEITTLDEGFVPSLEDRALDGQPITESYIDEGIYSLTSLESTQERIQEHSGKQLAEEVEVKEAIIENINQDMIIERVPDHGETENTKEIDPKQVDTCLFKKEEMPELESSGLCDAEVLTNTGVEETDKTNQSHLISNNDLPPPEYCELVKQASVERDTHKEPECSKTAVDVIGDAQDNEGQINGQTESQKERINSEEVEGETECQKTESPSEEIRGQSREESGIFKGSDEVDVQTGDKAGEDVLRAFPHPQESFSSEVYDTLANPLPTNHGASKTTPDLNTRINIPLIAISSEPEEQDEEVTCYPKIHEKEYAGNDNAHQAEERGSKGTNSPQNPGDLSCDLSDNIAKTPADIPSCLVSESMEPTASEQISNIESGHLDDTDKHDISTSSNADICAPDTAGNTETSEAKQDSQTGNTQDDLILQASSVDVQSVNTEQKINLTDQLDGHQDKLDDTSPDSETAIRQQSALDSLNSKQNGTGILCSEAGKVSRDIDLFYTDFERNSPINDLINDPIEPMDLFYPDKEADMFTELPDTEMQSWPSVLSVSALQPAPASETLPDDQPLSLLNEDFRNGVLSIQENDKVIPEFDEETDKGSEPQKHTLLHGEKMVGPRADDVPADGSDLSEAEQQSSGSARENTEPMRSDTKCPSRQDESQIPPVLRHRKGLRFTESTDNQTAVAAVTRTADSGDSDFWRSESWELYLLLLLWLLLYCFWLLPQMDLKTLPSLLLNLKH